MTVVKIACNDRVIALKVQAEPVYTPTLEYGDDKVEKLYNTMEEILENDGKGVTNTITM